MYVLVVLAILVVWVTGLGFCYQGLDRVPVTVTSIIAIYIC